MEIEIRFTCEDVDWAFVSNTLKQSGMAFTEPDIHRQAFENSYVTVFAYHENRLVGFGRAISDGMYQAAVYDLAIAADYQRQGIGRKLMQAILSKVSHCNVILYSTIGKEPFYESLGFRRMKTGMALFKNAALMREKGATE